MAVRIAPVTPSVRDPWLNEGDNAERGAGMSLVDTAHISFRYESDLVDVVRDQIALAVFNKCVRDQVEVFTEVPAVLGVPDVSAVRFAWEIVDARIRDDVRPLTSAPALRAAFALRGTAMEASQLAARLRMSKEHVRRSVVPELRSRGWLTEGTTVLQLKSSARPVGLRIVTVEAKLRDWHGALGQARRQRYSAHAAYIALERRAALRLVTELPAIARQGIGVIAVDAASATMRVLHRPAARLDALSNRVARALIAERGLELLGRGEHAGEIHPVFGWTLPQNLAVRREGASTRADAVGDSRPLAYRPDQGRR